MERSCNNLKSYLTQGGKVRTDNKEQIVNESRTGAEKKIVDVIHCYIKTL